MTYHLAIDLGASSGRLILGWLEDGLLRLEEVHRFPNGPVRRGGHLCWDLEELFRQILTGMRRCRELGKIPATLGVDTWGVDYVLLDGDGAVLGDTISYRDQRTRGMPARAAALVSDETLYARTGIQQVDYNTLYQLLALKEESPELLNRADTLLMVPDYLHYRLTGIPANEYTIATTTALVNARSRAWDLELIGQLGLPERPFRRPLTPPGTTLGGLAQEVRSAGGYDCSVVLPPSHDTASAFLAVPARGDDAVTISSGTWSLLGVENPAPVTNEESRRANFTNEGGYQYRYRYLRNIMGLWMLQRIRAEGEPDLTFPALARQADQAECDALVDVDDPRFFAPECMTDAVREVCRETGQSVPRTTAEAARCVYQSLARCYARSVGQLERLLGRPFSAVHVVGGGSRDDYLNQLTAEQTGLPVFAGPTEGSALGSLMVQMLSAASLRDLAQAREAVRLSFPIREYLP